ncbi:Uncharacterised protein [Mycobacteroides abscessus subsp. abscessus]|nr:Uncharacterised protein [Mycobacteroides abscessus subsp. abscessus]
MPESADVMKNVLTRMMAMMERTIPSGKFENTAKRVSSVASPEIEIFFTCSRYMAEPPNVENHRNPMTVGTRRTPNTNSLILRPLETRAMNMPTKGDQAIHQAQ